jgi:ribosomal protein S2
MFKSTFLNSYKGNFNAQDLKNRLKMKFILKNDFIRYSNVGHSIRTSNVRMNINFLGVRKDRCIINTEKSVESLNTVAFVCQHCARVGLSFLFVNLVAEYNSVIKVVASYSYESSLLEEFNGGSFTNSLLKSPGVVFVSNSKVHSSVLKEAYSLGLPTVGLHDSDHTTDTLIYPILASDDSLETQREVLKIVCNAIVKGKFYRFLDFGVKKNALR